MKFCKYFDKTTWKKCEGTVNDEPSLTDQSFKGMCEIDPSLLAGRI